MEIDHARRRAVPKQGMPFILSFIDDNPTMLSSNTPLACEAMYPAG